MRQVLEQDNPEDNMKDEVRKNVIISIFAYL